MKNTIIMTAAAAAILSVSSFSAFANDGLSANQRIEANIIQTCGPVPTKGSAADIDGTYASCADKVKKESIHKKRD